MMGRWKDCRLLGGGGVARGEESVEEVYSLTIFKLGSANGKGLWSRKPHKDLLRNKLSLVHEVHKVGSSLDDTTA